MKLIALALLALALTAEEPKAETRPLTADQVALMQSITARAQSLQKEANDLQRAITAERQVLDLQYQNLLLQVCGDHPKDPCTIAASDPDPKKWAAVITKKPKETAKAEPPKK